MKTKVALLHGAYHGPDIWDALSLDLASLDIECVAPRLSFGTEEEAADILESEEGPLIVLAHSLAGTLVPAIERRSTALDRPCKPIFLAAYLPRRGQSVSELARMDAGAKVRDALCVDRLTGTVSLDPKGAGQALYGDELDDTAARTALARLRPQSVTSFQREASSEVRRGSPYLVCQKDQAITTALQRRMASDAGCQPLVGLDCGHMPMITCPRDLAKVLLSLAPELLWRERH